VPSNPLMQPTNARDAERRPRPTLPVETRGRRFSLVVASDSMSLGRSTRFDATVAAFLRLDCCLYGAYGLGVRSSAFAKRDRATV
jgi:hypothetical protein